MKKRTSLPLRYLQPVKTLQWWLFGLIGLLLTIGYLAIFEASATEALHLTGDQWYFIKQHTMWLVIGLVALGVGRFMPMTLWQKYAPYIYGLGIVLLVAVLIPGIGVSVKGASRWLEIGGFRLQPVEVMKFGVIVFFSSWLPRHQRVGPFLTFSLLPAIFVLLQPDLGSTLIVLTIAFALYFCAGAKLSTIISMAGAGILGVLLLILSSPYRLDRLQTYLNPTADPLGTGYHIRQITLALGNGGIFGQGIGQSRQKYQYLPEASTDSIFAIVAEETGFIGALVVLSVYLLLFFTLSKIVRQQTPRSFEYLLAIGVTLWITIHILFNLAAVVALMPLTGVPLPFISRGGSSLVTMLFAIGMAGQLASGGNQRKQKE